MSEFPINDEDLSSLKDKVVVLTGTANSPLYIVMLLGSN